MKEINPQLLRPIPLVLPDVSGWKEVPIEENGESLVPLGPFSPNSAIFTSSVYAGEKSDSPYAQHPLKGSLIAIFARDSIASQLITAQSMLPSGMHLLVLDAYRPLEVQQAAYDYYIGELSKKQPGQSQVALEAETQKYVSIPSTDFTRPSPHNTGGAVDLVIVEFPNDIQRQLDETDKQILEAGTNWEEIYRLEYRKIALIGEHGTQLDFGVPFDWGGMESTLNYYETLAQRRDLTPNEQLARQNRRLLYNIMIQADFEPYLHEWWHFNSKKSQMGAKTSGSKTAEYGAAEFTEENLRHAEMRRNHRLGSIRIFEGTHPPIDQIRLNHPAIDIVKKNVDESGDIRSSFWQRSAIIAP